MNGSSGSPMQGCKESCLRWAIFYVIVAAGVAAVIYLRFPKWEVALIGGAVAGFFLFMTIAYVIGVRMRRKEIGLVRRAMEGGRPEDGERIAAVGTVGSSMETFESPMTRRRCVLYEYKVLTPGNQQAGVYEGFALAPTSIDGPRGSIRLMAAPELAFPQENINRMEHRRNMREYLERTQLAVRTFDLKKEMASLRDLLADDDGRIRYDVHRPEASLDLDSMAMWEKTLAPGDAVCAIGRYSAARNALVPDPKAIMHPVKILRGDGPSVIRELKGKDKIDAFMGCGCLIPLLLAALLGLVIVPLDAIEQTFPEKDPSWPEVRLEQLLEEKVRPKVAGTRFSPGEGEYSILLERGQARGKLTYGGTTTRLTASSAKRAGDAIDVTLTGDLGAGVVLRIRKDKTVESLRVLGGPAIASPTLDLNTLGVDEQAISGRVTYLDARDGPLLRAMFRAAISN